MAAVTAAVALNSMVAMQYVGTIGQVVLLAAVFGSLAVGGFAVAKDAYSRSSQAVASLRSIGASRRDISSAFAFAIVGYGVAGAAVGAFAGAGLGSALSGSGVASSLVDAVCVIGASAAATAAGFYAGAGAAWRS